MTIRATLSISVIVECPECSYPIDLLEENDTNGVAHNDEGGVLREVCPTDGRHWSEACDKFVLEDVTCSSCKHTFAVNGVDW